jgi:hypothetical protein
MDIFTTVLTRVVPVPIKRANLKVKALEKEAAASSISEDDQGLEEQEHKLLNKKSPDESGDFDNSAAKGIKASPVPTDNTGQHIDVFDDNEVTQSKNDDQPHLDIFV